MQDRLPIATAKFREVASFVVFRIERRAQFGASMTPLMRCPMVRQRRAAAPSLTTEFVGGRSEHTRKSRQAGKIAVADCQISSRRVSLGILIVAPLREPTRSFRCTLGCLSHAGPGGRGSLPPRLLSSQSVVSSSSPNIRKAQRHLSRLLLLSCCYCSGPLPRGRRRFDSHIALCLHLLVAQAIW